MIIPTDQDLIAKLTLTEDAWSERKSSTDTSGWLRTTVAFANSVPIDFPAVLFLGVSDQGIIQPALNVEKTIQSYSDFIQKHAYPPIYQQPHVLNHQRNACVAVIVPGSELRPHFAGKSYIRDGMQIKDASDEQFAALIAQRESKARLILGWKGKTIYFKTFPRNSSGGTEFKQMKVKDCNSFFVELEIPSGGSDSYPLSRIDVAKEIIYYNE